MKAELTLAIHMEPQRPTWLAYERWIKKLGEMSGGRINVTITQSSVVGIEEWNMLKSNECDMARVFTLNMEPFPMHTVPALPYLMPEDKGDLAILNSVYDKYLYREWQDVKVLWLGLMSKYHLHTSQKPVRTLEDFKGMKILASGLVAELAKVWGGIPTELVAPEGAVKQNAREAHYNALKTGEIDGSIATFEVTKDFELYDVTKYHTYLNVVRDVNAVAMNLETWNGLSPDIQKVFEDLNPWAQRELDTAQATEAEEARDLLIQKGHTMIELPPEEYARWVKAAGTLNEESLAKLDAKGLPATAIAEEIRKRAAGLS